MTATPTHKFTDAKAPMSRRSFLALAAVGPWVLTLPGCSSPELNLDYHRFTPNTPGELTRFAVLQSVCARAQQAGNASPPVQRAMDDLWFSLPVGMCYPEGHRAVALLDYCRDQPEDDPAARILGTAIAIGYLLHRTAERSLENSLKRAGISNSSFTEARLAHDAAVIRQTLAPDTTVDLTNAEAVAALLHAADHRLRVGMHTILPDGDQPAQWVHDLIAWELQQQQYRADLAELIAHPQPEDYRRYVTDLRFLDPNDQPLQPSNESGSLYRQACADTADTLQQIDHVLSGKDRIETLVESQRQTSAV